MTTITTDELCLLDTTMADLDLIARVYFTGTVGQQVPKIVKTSPNYPIIFPRLQRPKERDYTRRQSTESSEESVSSGYDKPYIELWFNDIPKSHHGIVFGSDPRCDVALFSSGISYHHFIFIFDDARRFIVKDWDSHFETEVTYDKKEKKKRSDFPIFSFKLLIKSTELETSHQPCWNAAAGSVLIKLLSTDGPNGNTSVIGVVELNNCWLAWDRISGLASSRHRRSALLQPA